MISLQTIRHSLMQQLQRNKSSYKGRGSQLLAAIPFLFLPGSVSGLQTFASNQEGFSATPFILKIQ